MAQRDSRHTGKDNKGKPGGTIQDKSETKTVKNKEELEREEELRKEYTDEQNNPDPEGAPVKNPNRNTDKTDIDKGRYGGSSN
ncbi:hypothetical protein OKW21_005872 [Catalinimonas alkaloidigena]|uniref:hypothetical protein n=1 Tax=Catalinimonas alkaloidigena TaxID=1075417 RepID=UPI002406D0AA|nr:hypothetical protein [Catalinimonas alkaloidigena]MDF9800609.1 hypothetical protein [Catalinimonas alkaloidigena]